MICGKMTLACSKHNEIKKQFACNKIPDLKLIFLNFLCFFSQFKVQHSLWNYYFIIIITSKKVFIVRRFVVHTALY